MRKYAILKTPFPLNNYSDICKRIILDCISEKEVFLYYSVSIEDEGCSFDNYFTNLETALEVTKEHGIDEDDWIDIDEPLKGCSRSFIRNVRRKENSKSLELFDGEKWVDFK